MATADRQLTALEAAQVMRDMDRIDERLQARVHGLTWMVWGLVAPAIFMTYAFAATRVADLPIDAHVPWFGLLWAPWAVLGLVFTALLWRSVGFVLPGKGIAGRELALHAGFFLAATIGLVVLAIVTDLPVYPPTIVLTGIGLVTTVLGTRDAFAGNAREGTFQAAVGALLMGFAVFEAIVLAGPSSVTTLATASFWNVFASAAGLGAIGLFRVLRS